MATVNPQPKDTGRRRDADAARVRVAADLRFSPFPRRYFYTLPLHLPEGTPLHSEDASRAARAVAETVAGSAPARWKLEQGRAGSLHVHIVTPLPPRAVHAFADARPVWNLRGLLAYLAKPADARRCRLRLTAYTPDEGTRAAEYRAALTDEAKARADRLKVGKFRLPPKSGWVGLRPLATASPLTCARLTIGLAFAACAYLLARQTVNEARRAPKSARSARRPLTRPLAPPVRRRSCEPYAPDRHTRGLTL